MVGVGWFTVCFMVESEESDLDLVYLEAAMWRCVRIFFGMTSFRDERQFFLLPPSAIWCAMRKVVYKLKWFDVCV